MKKAKISVFALALLALGACTSDDALVTDGGSSAFLGGDGYVSFNINLPTQTGTRAANDVFDDGVPCEYKVNDATLLLFKGESEAKATFYAAYTLTNTFVTDATTDDNITSSATVTQKITTDGIDEGENLYALVVLNKDGMLTIAGSGKTASGYFGNTVLTVGSTKFTDLQDQEYNADLSEIARATNENDGNFFMTNAPLFSTPGGNHDPSDGVVSTLAVIDPDNIHSTADAAEAAPAANVYVERGVAKVTVSTSATFISELDNEYNVEINGFVLDQTNTKMYPVRNTIDADWWGYKNSKVGESDKPYRFVGSDDVGKSIPGGNDYLYRTYWGIDPNYTSITDGELNSIVGQTPTTLVAADGTSSVYCLENTFNVENMNKNATTRIIVSATITKNGSEGDNSFYTLDGNNTILDYDAVEDHIKDQLKGIELVHNALVQYTSDETAFFANVVKISLDITSGKSVDNAEIKIELGGSSTDFSDDGEAYSALSEGLEDVVSAINDDVSVSYYAGGVCYYPILIEHFGDDLTPWATENISGYGSYPAEGSGYGSSAEEAWLGRWGVLRNNWYVINVTKLQNVGTATVPEVTDDPDDPMYKYIAVNINVLAWAMRVQDVTL